VGGFGLVIDPLALLTETMLERAADHLARIAASVLPAHGVAAMVVHPSAYGSRVSESVWGTLVEAAVQADLPLVSTDRASGALLDSLCPPAGVGSDQAHGRGPVRS
jgi:hypothetical protein